MKNKKFSLNKLFYNNRFVLVFSIVAAVFVWIISGLQFSPEDERIIEDVPVTVELSQPMQAIGLKAFGEADYRVDVTVKGKRYLVSPKALSADDIVVKANTKYVDSAGKYTLALSASAADNTAEFEITNISVAYVDIFFDVEKTAEFPIEPDLNAPNGVVPDGYYSPDPVLSQKVVKITGPETEVNKIASVVCPLTLDAPIEKSDTYLCTLTALSSAGTEPDYLTYSSRESGMTMTVYVYKIETMKAGILFNNYPPDYIKKPFAYSVTPEDAAFAVLEDKAEGMGGVFNILTVDFSQLKPGTNTFLVDEVSTETGMLFDESVKEFTVTVTVPDVEQKTLNVPSAAIRFIGNEAITPVVDSAPTITVTLVGPAESLKAITTDQIEIICDLSGISAGQGVVTDVPVSVSQKAADDCWIYGNYAINITV